jgi:pyruvate dehydrogenase E1 component alpha subunit
MKRDPIMLLREAMEKQDGFSDADMTALDDELKAIVEDAWNFADESPEPPVEALWEDVFVETTSDEEILETRH